MNEVQYRELCKSCDQLLLLADKNDDRISIPWLHVIRPHSQFLSGYAEIFDSKKGAGCKRLVRNLLSALRNLGRSFIGGGKIWSSVEQLPSKCDLLIVSHLVNKSNLGNENDFHYGTAAKELADQGFDVTIALITYTAISESTLTTKWQHSRVPRLIFATVLAFNNELPLYIRSIRSAFRLKLLQFSRSIELDRSVASHAALEATSGGSIHALRIGEQIKVLVSRMQPSALMITYEGHSWERVAFSAARSVKPGICCIGYQNASLFYLQHAVQRKLSDRYNPNIILTSGNVAQEKLRKNVELLGTRIESLGHSNRSCLRNSILATPRSTKKKLCCLVLPEGTVSECMLLFTFSLRCACIMPNIDFIWRLHPTMSFDILLRENKEFQSLPRNINLSSALLHEDIACSRWALYRGSTAIVQAAVCGVQPVYLHQPKEIPIDTLYEIPALHKRVCQPIDFQNLANEDEDTYCRDVQAVQDYCERIYTPMDVRVLANCMQAKS